jgi:hypothetical protein
LPWIEDLDIFGYILYSLLPGPIPAMIGQFLLECSPETLHRRIVVAVTFPAHRSYEAMLFQDIPETLEQHWLPRSEWCRSPWDGRLVSIARYKDWLTWFLVNLSPIA